MFIANSNKRIDLIYHTASLWLLTESSFSFHSWDGAIVARAGLESYHASYLFLNRLEYKNDAVTAASERYGV